MAGTNVGESLVPNPTRQRHQTTMLNDSFVGIRYLTRVPKGACRVGKCGHQDESHLCLAIGICTSRYVVFMDKANERYLCKADQLHHPGSRLVSAKRETIGRTMVAKWVQVQRNTYPHNSSPVPLVNVVSHLKFAKQDAFTIHLFYVCWDWPHQHQPIRLFPLDL